MSGKEILIWILICIVSGVWLLYGNKLGRHLKNIVIIVVDIIAFFMFYVNEIEFYKKILLIVAMIMMCLFWIFLENRDKKDITLKDVKKSRLDDMCFCIGIVFIIVFLFNF